MNEYMTAREAAEAFCRTWLEINDPAGAAAFLAEDVCFVGAGPAEFAQGKAETAAYIRRDIQELTEPFTIRFQMVQEHRVAEGLHNLFAELTLKNSIYTWYVRGGFLLEEGAQGWMIKCLHLAEPGKSQRDGECYPHALVLENLARQRQELLDMAMPGGMMGGYIEKGFPFYFINRRMLSYLGYRDEAEFVADIGGLVTNCMHPDDQVMVDETVAAQLAEKGEYVVEYRMKRRNGDYIWVHDLGRQVQAEDGRPAIVSVCLDITARKAAQDEVLRLYNNIPGAVFRCRFDADFSVIDANDGLFDFLGYSREEFAALGNRMSAVIHPEDLTVMAERLKEQLRHGNGIHNENRLICKGGGVKWISIKAQLFVEGGEPYFYCVFVDITEEKRLQERMLDQYEQELTYFAELSLQEGCIQGTINVTRDRVESYLANTDVAVAQVGNTYRETIEKLAASAVDQSYGEVIRETLNRDKVLADYAGGRTDYQFSFLRRRSDGGVFWERSKMRTCVNPETRDVILFFYTADVTEQRLQEQLLEKVSRLDYDIITEIDLPTDRYRLVVGENRWGPSIPPQGDFQAEIRRVADRCMGEADKREFLGKLAPAYMRRELAKKDFYTFIIEVREARGKRIKRFQVFYISKELDRVCMTRADVTDVVRRERRQKEQLAAALAAAEQANEAKSDFLSRMSHEIRTPMNAIIGMSAIAAQAIGNDEQVADCISKIGISSRFLLSLINDILDMSRIESGKMLLQNGRILIEEFLVGLNAICFEQAAAKGVDYECIVDPTLEESYVGDAMKLQQVLLNILSNAIKFTPRGGRVTISAAQREKTGGSAILRFVVSDTGVGMNEAFLPHIFEAFSQESTGTTAIYGGTGLGLAISKSIVEMMDGSITVRSGKGIGSEFTVDVKVAAGEASQRHPGGQPRRFPHLKTLVVDDNRAVCECAVALLREMGVTADWVDSGQKALDRVRELQTDGRFYDIILMDWKMPGMDGMETARHIRELVGQSGAIIIAAYDWAAIEQEAKMAGADLLIGKPLFKSSLVSAFTRALGEKEAPPEPAAEFDFTGKRVLLVEDNFINTEVASLLLRSKGFQVEAAENGLQALERFSKSQAGYFDAILMDIRMPLMDGLTAAENIRRLDNADAATIPIIAMTANAFDGDMEKSRAAGMNAHLAKPIEPERLYQTLHDFLFRREL